jgi:hypothetical protein
MYEKRFPIKDLNTPSVFLKKARSNHADPGLIVPNPFSKSCRKWIYRKNTTGRLRYESNCTSK